MSPVTCTLEDDMAIITIDNPPVNATSQAVRAGMEAAVNTAVSAGVSKGIVRCNGKTFIAGGDISEFGNAPQLPHLPDVYQLLEDSPVLWLAAMHGTVLGGGFELAMACDFRIALAGTRFGLPEVNLGLIPGAGGTQRLPRLVGIPMASDLCSSGRMISATELLEAGGLDAIVSEPLAVATKEFFASPSATHQPVPVSYRPVAPVPQDFFETQRIAITKKAKGAKAPLNNLEAVEWTTHTDFATGQQQERKLHLSLRESDQSVALRHVFFAEREVTKPIALKNTTGRDVESVVIVGGGLMGSGIAAACLNANLSVRMIETNPETGRRHVEKLLQGALKRGKINESAYQQLCANFICNNSYDIATDGDLAIEAVFEDLNTKRDVFKSLANHMSEDAILATNTSYINPADIAHDIANPSRIVGLHFFSPAHIMKLLEIVKTPDTSAEVLATSFKLAKKLRKVGVLAGICEGFIGNRMLAASRRQADYMLADGAYPQQVDRAMRAYGMPMGPYELQDLTGLQIGYANRQRLAATRNPAERYITIADQLCEQQRLGQRGGKGWYRYEKESRTPIVDQHTTDLIDTYVGQQGNGRTEFTDDEIQQRIIAVLINEGQRILEEGIAERALDIDIVKIHGYGFPRYKGGPMHYASCLGDTTIKDILQRVTAQSPNSWVIAEKYR